MDPCLELNLFHDSANLPRLALRLRLRLSALSSRSEQPRSTSAASLHFLPMLSWRGSAGKRSGWLLAAGLLPACAQLWVGAALASAASCQSPALLPPLPHGCACARDWLYRRLRLLAPPALQTACFCAPELLSTPWPPPSPRDGRPTPGATDTQLGSNLQLPQGPLPELGANLTPSAAACAHRLGGDSSRLRGKQKASNFLLIPSSLFASWQQTSKCPLGKAASTPGPTSLSVLLACSALRTGSLSPGCAAELPEYLSCFYCCDS